MMDCCSESRPCGPGPAGLGLVPPPPGQNPLRRRLGDFDAFGRDLIDRVERELFDGGPLGRDWDVEGDPRASLLVDLWAYVAELVAAYSELTAAEAYLGTASDWTDLRRLAARVGYRPRPRVAAQGWVRVEVDRGCDPVLPAGTRVEAPGTTTRPAQPFEVAADTQLRSDWNALTATWVPVAKEVVGREVRFLGDPGFRLGDLVLLVREQLTADLCKPPDWSLGWSADFWTQYWRWYLCLVGITPQVTPLAVAGVVALSSEAGTTLVEFDRELGGLLGSKTEAYAAYRVLASAGQARRLTKVVTIDNSTVSTADLTSAYTDAIFTNTSIVLDAALEQLSAGQTVAIVGWDDAACDIVTVQSHTPVSWEVAPGTTARASKLGFEAGVPTLIDAAGQTGTTLTLYVLDRRVVARHYEFPEAAEGATTNQLRLYPAPSRDHELTVVAVQTNQAGGPTWEVLACKAASAQETQPDEEPDPGSGLIVDLVNGPPKGTLVSVPASGNLAPVRHGTTTTAVVGSGDATQTRQAFTLPDAPIAYDVDAAGNVVPTQVLRVDGVQWVEVQSLYGQGAAAAFTVQLEADGGNTVQFGDGDQGARLPTGRGNVRSSYRVGGGTVGEVESAEIASLLGSVRGVKKVEGAGPTTGGADQDDERCLRALVPGRTRALGRAVSGEDLVDLALGYPGVTHAASWSGQGPPGCACGRSGLHLAFLRLGTAGPRVPEPSEVAALAAFLDTCRDASVPLCVCAAALTDPPLALNVQLAVDPSRLVADVVAAATAALVDPDGPLGPSSRSLGQALDRSDVFSVLHGVPGVVGVPSLVVPGAAGEFGRRPAARYELIVLDAAPVVGGAAV
jgi:hypothetical protein